VYLFESLDVLQNEGDEVGTAQVYMQLGRVHLKSRQMARKAGTAYDRLLVARWQISRQDYGSAAENLHQVIEDSLSINRFGAAASAYDTLARLHAATGATYEAEQAVMQAASLYASSGQPDRARDLLRGLTGIEPWRVAAIEEDIERNYDEFQNHVEQIERARDYQRLYHHYLAKGDERRAWKLRLLAGQSLAKASKRAMYHRQPDVLAVLYNSNVAKEQAQDYFDRARRTFDDSGLVILSAHTATLEDQIF
jgi:tetratricopeptide (TPR) repeat protein